VQSTGHATFFDTPQGDWYAAFLARRNINGSSPLGRETFLTTLDWNADGWPVLNGGKPILLSDEIGPLPDAAPLQPFEDSFEGPSLHDSWYQLRIPYTQNFEVNNRLILHPNVFSLSERDVPAALLRKQKSLNMTFSADLLDFNGTLGPRQSVGISSYLSELQHQDIYVSGCANVTGNCLFTSLIKNGTKVVC
jgi:beta-xylosidase